MRDKRKFNIKLLSILMAACLIVPLIFASVFAALESSITSIPGEQTEAATTGSENSWYGELDANTGENRELNLTIGSLLNNNTMGAAQLNGSTRTYFLRVGEVMSDVIIGNSGMYFWDPMPSADLVGIFSQYSAVQEQRFKFYGRLPGKTEAVLRFAQPTSSTAMWYSCTFVFVVRANPLAHSAASPINTAASNRIINPTSTKISFDVSTIATNPSGVAGASSLKIIAASVRYPSAVDASAYASYDIGFQTQIKPATGTGLNNFSTLTLEMTTRHYQSFGVEFLVKNFEVNMGHVGIITCYVEDTLPSQFYATPVEHRSVDPHNSTLYSATNAASIFEYSDFGYTASPGVLPGLTPGSTLNNDPYGSYQGGFTTPEVARDNYFHTLTPDTTALSQTPLTGMDSTYTAKVAVPFDVVLHSNKQYENFTLIPQTYSCTAHPNIYIPTGAPVGTIHIPATHNCVGNWLGSGYYICNHGFTSVLQNMSHANGPVISCPTIGQLGATPNSPGVAGYQVCTHGFATLANGTTTFTHMSTTGGVACTFSNLIPAVMQASKINTNTLPFYLSAGQDPTKYPQSAIPLTNPIPTVTVNGNTAGNVYKVYLNPTLAGAPNTSALRHLTNIQPDSGTDLNYAEIENVYAFDSAYFTATLVRRRNASYVQIAALRTSPANDPKYLILTVTNIIGGQRYRKLVTVIVKPVCSLDNNPDAYPQLNNAPTPIMEGADRLRVINTARTNVSISFIAGKGLPNSIAGDGDDDMFGFYDTVNNLMFDNNTGTSQTNANTWFNISKSGNNEIRLTPKGVSPNNSKIYLKVTDSGGAEGFIEITVTIYNQAPVFSADFAPNTDPVPIVIAESDSYAATPGGQDAARWAFSVLSRAVSDPSGSYSIGVDADSYPQPDVLSLEFINWTQNNDAYLVRKIENTVLDPNTGVQRAGGQTLLLIAKKRVDNLPITIRMYDGYTYITVELRVSVSNSRVQYSRNALAASFVNDPSRGQVVVAGTQKTFTGSELGVDFDGDSIVVQNFRVPDGSGLPTYVVNAALTTSLKAYVKAEIIGGQLILTALAKTTQHLGYSGTGHFALEILLKDSGDKTNGSIWITVPVLIASTIPVAQPKEVTGTHGSVFKFTAADLAYDADANEVDFLVNHNHSTVTASRYADHLRLVGAVDNTGDFADIHFEDENGAKTTDVAEYYYLVITLKKFTGKIGPTERIDVNARVCDLSMTNNDAVSCNIKVNVQNNNPLYRFNAASDGTNIQYNKVAASTLTPYGTQLNPIRLTLAVNDAAYPSKIVIGPYDYIDDVDLDASLHDFAENSGGKPNVKPDGSAQIVYANKDFLAFSAVALNVSNNAPIGYLDYTYGLNLVLNAKFCNTDSLPILLMAIILDSYGSQIELYFSINVINSSPVSNNNNTPGALKGNGTYVPAAKITVEPIIEVEERYVEAGDYWQIVELPPEIDSYAEYYSQDLLIDYDEIPFSSGNFADVPRFLDEFYYVKDKALCSLNSDGSFNPGNSNDADGYVIATVRDDISDVNGKRNILRITALSTTETTDFIDGCIWLAFFATDGTADALTDPTLIAASNHKSKILWLKINVVNSVIVQPEASKNIVKNKQIAAADTYQKMMIRAHDDRTRGNFSQTQSTVSVHDGQDYIEGDDAYPLYLLARDPDNKYVYIRSTSTGGIGIEHFDATTARMEVYLDNGNQLSGDQAEPTKLYDSGDGTVPNKLNEVVNKKNWYIILTYMRNGRMSMDFTLSDRQSINAADFTNLSVFNISFNIVNVAVFEKYLGAQREKASFEPNGAGTMTPEEAAAEKAKANPVIPISDYNNAYVLDLYDVISHTSDTNVFGNTTEALSGFVCLAKNTQQIQNLNETFYTTTGDGYLQSTVSSVKLKQGDQKYVSILGGASRGFPFQENDSKQLRGLALMGLQRTSQPIELILSVNIVQSVTTYADQDLNHGIRIGSLYYGEGVDINGDGVYVHGDKKQTLTVNGETKECEPDIYTFKITISIKNSEVKDNGYTVIATDYDYQIINGQFTGLPPYPGYKRSELRGLTTTSSGVQIMTAGTINEGATNKIKLPIADDDKLDTHYISFASIDRGDEIDWTGQINFVKEYDNHRYAPFNDNGSAHSQTYNYEDYFSVSKSSAMDATQVLNITPKKRTTELPGGFFPLYFIVHDDFAGSSYGKGLNGEPITAADILDGGNIEGLVSRTVFCVYIFIENSVPYAVKKTVRLTQRAGDKVEFYLSDLVNDTDMIRMTDDKRMFDLNNEADRFGNIGVDYGTDIINGTQRPHSDFLQLYIGQFTKNNNADALEPGLKTVYKSGIEYYQKVGFTVYTRAADDYMLSGSDRIKTFTLYFYDMSYVGTQGREKCAAVTFEIYISNSSPTQLADPPFTDRKIEMYVNQGVTFTVKNERTTGVPAVIRAASDIETFPEQLKIVELTNTTLFSELQEKYSSHLNILRTGSLLEFNIIARAPTPLDLPITFEFTVDDGEDEFSRVVCSYTISIKSQPPQVIVANKEKIFGVKLGQDTILNINDTNESTGFVRDQDGDVLNVVDKPMGALSGRPETVFSNKDPVLRVDPRFVGASSFVIGSSESGGVNSSSNVYFSLNVESYNGKPAIRLTAQNVYTSDIGTNPVFYVSFYVADPFFNACLVTVKVVVENDEISQKFSTTQTLNLAGVGNTTNLQLSDYILGSSGQTTDAEYNLKTNEYSVLVSQIISGDEVNLAEYSPYAENKYVYYGKPDDYKGNLFDYFDLPTTNGILYGKTIVFESKKRTPSAFRIKIVVKKKIWKLSTDKLNASPVENSVEINLSINVLNSAATVNRDTVDELAGLMTDGTSKLKLSVSEINPNTLKPVPYLLPLLGTTGLNYLMTDPDQDNFKMLAFKENVTVLGDSVNQDFKNSINIEVTDTGYLAISILRKHPPTPTEKEHVTRTITIQFTDLGEMEAELLEFNLTIVNSAPVAKFSTSTIEITNDKMYEVAYNNQLYSQIPVNYFISDKDQTIAPESERFTVKGTMAACTTNSGYDVKQSGTNEIIANVKYNSNTATFTVLGKSNKRGAQSATLTLQIEDSSEQAALIVLTFIVGNTAPVAVASPEKINLINYNAGVERYFFFNRADHNAYYSGKPNAPQFVELFTDVNEGDTFRFSNLTTGVTVADQEKPLVRLISNSETGMKGFVIAPIKGKTGIETLTITCYDSDPNNLASGTLGATASLTINIADDPENIDINYFSIIDKHIETVTLEKLLYGEATVNGKAVDWAQKTFGYSIAANSISYYKPGETVDFFSVSPEVSNDTQLLSAELVFKLLNDQGTQVSEGGSQIQALRQGQSKIKLQLKVLDKIFTIAIDVRVNKNEAPKIRAGKDELYTMSGDGGNIILKGSRYGDYGYVTYLVIELLEDDDAELKIISAKSSRTLVVDVFIVQNEGIDAIDLVCYASGTSVITLEVQDAANIYTIKFDYRNEDLLPLSWWAKFIGDIVENPTGIIVFSVVVVLIVAAIAIVIGVRKKKRRMMEDIERQLINEMELEEQLLKLSAAAPGLFDELPQVQEYAAIGAEKLAALAQQNADNLQIGTAEYDEQMLLGELNQYLQLGEGQGDDNDNGG